MAISLAASSPLPGNTSVKVATTGSGTVKAVGETFNLATDQKLNNVRFYARRVGSPTGSANCIVYTVSGTIGTNATPNSAQRTSKAIDVATISTSWQVITLPFPVTNAPLAAGNYYAMFWYNSGGDASNYIEIAMETSPAYFGSSATYVSSFTGTNSGTACTFYMYTGDQVSYRSSDTYNSGASTTSSVVLNKPSGTTTGDIVYAAITVYDTTNTVSVTPPAGWTASANTNLSSTYTVKSFWLPATASEPSSYTFTLSSATQASAVIAAYSGVDAVVPSGGGSVGTAQSGTSVTGVSFATTADQSMYLRYISSYNTTSAITVSAPGTALTTRADTSNTASPYIQTAILDPLVFDGQLTLSIPAATLSASATTSANAGHSFRPDLSQAFTPKVFAQRASTFTSVSSGALNVQARNTGDPMFINIMIAPGTESVTSITSTGATWTKVAHVVDASNALRNEVWYAAAPSGYSTVQSATVNFSGTVSKALPLQISYTGAIWTGNYSTNTGISATISNTLSTTVPQSVVYSYMAYNSNASLGTISTPSYETFAGWVDGATHGYRVLRDSIPAYTSGITRTHTYNVLSGTPEWSVISYELAPAHTSKSHTSDAMVRVATTKTHSTDSLVATSATKTQTTNSVVRGQVTKTHTADTLTHATSTKTQTTNSFIAIRLTRTQTANSMVRVVFAKTHTTDHKIHGTFTQTHMTDSVVYSAPVPEGTLTEGLVERKNIADGGSLSVGDYATGGLDRTNIPPGGELEPATIDDSGIWPQP